MPYETFTRRIASQHARRVVSALGITLSAFALVWIGRVSAQGDVPDPSAAKSISTAVNKVDAVDTNIQACTQSTNFIDMPGMLVSFKSGGTAARPVIALFQGEWVATDQNTGVIRLTIDGVVQSGPDDVEMNFTTADETATHGFNFLSDRLAPGLHVARLQWRARGGVTCVNSRSLIVMHK
jgi:hypothetical protein